MQFTASLGPPVRFLSSEEAADHPIINSHLLLPLLSQGTAEFTRFGVSPAVTPATTPFRRIDISDKKRPCTAKPFYGRYELYGSDIFLYIEKLGVDERMDPKVKLAEITLPRDEDDLNEVLQASYQAFNSSITIHASHLAASLGSIKVMKWLRDKCGNEVLDRQAQETRNGKSVTTYTPLMSALFMSKTEAAIWLLNHGASPTVTNADGMTPFHLLASIGLPNEGADVRIACLTKIAAKLAEKSADLNARSGKLEHRTDAEAARTREKTPLELAAGRNSAYPKQALHLLTHSFHLPEEGSLFKEVDFVAKWNPTAAEVLLQKMQDRNLGSVKRQLRHEVTEQAQHGKHMEMFLRILKMSPVAGTRLLELLMIEPLVSNPQRYPLPLYTELPNGQMITTYQQGNEMLRPVWETKEPKEPAPRWHTTFRKDLPSDPQLHSNVFEVNVRALHMPGILNIGVLSALSMMQPTPHKLQIFGKVSVAAIINCVWDNCSATYQFGMMWELLLLVALLSMGLFPLHVRAGQEVVRSIIIANLLQDIMRVVYGFLTFSRSTGMPPSIFIWHFERGHCLRMLSLLLVLFVNVDSTGLKTGVHKVFVAYNVVIRCFDMTLTLRAVNPILGPLIIAVLNSFAPMRGMFFLAMIVFMTFAFAFLIFRDPNRGVGFVLLYLYEALFLSDRESAESISGLDVAQEQTLDFGQELYTGGGDDFVLLGTVVAALIAASTFSLVLLNLMIGMYTNYYEQMEPLAKLMFQQQRARECVGLMVTPAWALALGANGTDGNELGQNFVALGVALLFAFFVVCIMCQIPVLISGVMLMVVSLLYQVYLLYDFCNVDSRNDFLWVSYRVDLDEAVGMDEQAELRALRRETAEARVAHQTELMEVRRELNKLAKELAGILQKAVSVITPR